MSSTRPFFLWYSFKGTSATDATAIVAAGVVTGSTEFSHDESNNRLQVAPKLILPTGATLYNANVWRSEDMRKIRELFSDGLFFKFWFAVVLKRGLVARKAVLPNDSQAL